jgi:hypothetical protein
LLIVYHMRHPKLPQVLNKTSAIVSSEHDGLLREV